jgi:hypothetical protein
MLANDVKAFLLHPWLVERAAVRSFVRMSGNLTCLMCSRHSQILAMRNSMS